MLELTSGAPCGRIFGCIDLCEKNIDQIHFPFFLTKGIEMKLEETMASAKEHLFLMVIAQPSQQLFLALNFRLEKKY